MISFEEMYLYIDDKKFFYSKIIHNLFLVNQNLSFMMQYCSLL